LGSRGIAPYILDLSFTPRERAPGTHWIGDWVGTRAVLDTVVKEKFPTSIRNLTLETQSSSP